MFAFLFFGVVCIVVGILIGAANTSGITRIVHAVENGAEHIEAGARALAELAHHSRAVANAATVIATPAKVTAVPATPVAKK